MSDKTYAPSLARRILLSVRDNGDLITDVARLACELAVEYKRPVSEEKARQVAAVMGVWFDADGWVIES